MKETKTVGRNIIFFLSGQFASTIIAFFYIAIIPRQLGPEKLGQFSYWLSLSFILSTVIDFGTSFYSRYIPEFRIKEPGKIKALLKGSIKIDGFIFLGLLIILPVWLKLTFGELVAVFLGALFTAILLIFSQVFYSYEKLQHSSFIRNLLRVIRIALLLFIIKSGIKSLLWAVFLPELITALVYTLPFKKILPREKAFLPEGMKKYMLFGLYVYLSTVCFTALGRSIVILAKNIIGDLRMVGYTSIAVELSIYTLRIMAISVFFGALPSGIRYLASDDLNRLDRFLELSWRYGNMIIFPLCFGFFVLGDGLVGLFIGKEYVAGVPLMCSFLPSAIILFWFQVHNHLLFIYKKKEFLFYSSLISVLIFIAMAVVMVAKIGVYGLPLSLGIGLFIGYVYAYLRTRSFKRIRGYPASILKPVGSGLIMTIILLELKRVLMMHLVYLIFIGAVSYFMSIIFLKGISKKDYLKIKAIIFP